MRGHWPWAHILLPRDVLRSDGEHEGLGSVLRLADALEGRDQDEGFLQMDVRVLEEADPEDHPPVVRCQS